MRRLPSPLHQPLGALLLSEEVMFSNEHFNNNFIKVF
jgi:hypothetical protein